MQRILFLFMYAKIPSIHHLFKQNEKTYKQQINLKTHRLDAKVHVGLFNRLHVTHKNNTKVEMIYSGICLCSVPFVYIQFHSYVY